MRVRCALAALAAVACHHAPPPDSSAARDAPLAAPLASALSLDPARLPALAPALASGPVLLPPLMSAPALMPPLAPALASGPALLPAPGVASLAPLAPPPAPPPLTPFGTPAPIARYTCPVVLRGGPFHSFLGAPDTRLAFVDGDDWLALVNRSPTGALAPTYAPTDLVDVDSGTPRSAAACESAHDCLRRDAAAALHRMLDQMHGEGMTGRIQSAYRGFGTQCWVFAGWAAKARHGFCEATAQSALPGHSQHQLGTTVDLFTKDWADEGARTGEGVFRNGFGCTRGGKWLDENAWRFGFVVSYPIHPDDRKDGSRCTPRADVPVPIDPKTGYKHEPWHLRFIGVEAASHYHDAWLASEPGSPREITLEQWLRTTRGLAGDAELPVCDGCQCGACATLAGDDAGTPCREASLHLDGNGRVVAPNEEPRLRDVRVVAGEGGLAAIEVALHAPAHTPTQPPVLGAQGPSYGEGSTFMAVVPYPNSAPHAYADLPGAWRVAAEPVPPMRTHWPWRASMAGDDLAATWNRANLVLPSKAGDTSIRMRVAVPRGVRALRVTLLRDGAEHEVREVAVP